MTEVCTTCGLPKDLCVCASIAKESLHISVQVEKRKFGKVYTVVKGITDKEINMRELVKQLKNSLACGGTIKEGQIELQGDHKQRVKLHLVNLGFAPETIEIQ